MAATASVEVLKTRAKRLMVEFDPDSGSETAVTIDVPNAKTYIAIEGYRRFLFGLMHSVGTGGITTARISVGTDNTGTGATTVVEITPTTNDAVGDTSWVECDIEQIREVLPTATHIGLLVDLVTSTDELVIYAEFADPAHEYTGLTANYIA